MAKEQRNGRPAFALVFVVAINSAITPTTVPIAANSAMLVSKKIERDTTKPGHVK